MADSLLAPSIHPQPSQSRAPSRTGSMEGLGKFKLSASAPKPITHRSKFVGLKETYDAVTARREDLRRELDAANMRLKTIHSENNLLLDAMQIVVPSQPALVTILQQIEADSHIPSGHGTLSADVPVPIYSDQHQNRGALRHRDVLHESQQRPPSGLDGTSAVFDGNRNGIGNADYDHQHVHAHAHMHNTNANGRTRDREYREQDEPAPADEEIPTENPSFAEREAGHSASAPDTNGR